MRICFWNTNKNRKINDYISDIIVENIVDIFVLAEYEASIEELKRKLALNNIVIEQAITIGCDRTPWSGPPLLSAEKHSPAN